MLLLFSIRETGKERVVHSVYCACLSFTFINFCTECLLPKILLLNRICCYKEN